MPGDIFKDGASPELEVKMAEQDALVREFFRAGPKWRAHLLAAHIWLRAEVVCCECGQTLPGEG